MEETTTPASPVKITMNYGAILGLSLIVVSVSFYLINEPQSSIQQYISYALLVFLIIKGTQNYRDHHLDGNISYGKALSTGTLIAFFGSLIISFYLYLFLTFVDASVIDTILNTSEQSLIDKGLSDTEINRAMEYTRMFTTPVMIFIFSILGNTFLGFIFSLITAIFLKKEDKSFESNFR